MQISQVGVYGTNGELRTIDFRLNSLNVITGRSNTGKSTILEIIDYCLGRKSFTVRAGVNTKFVSWYFVNLAFGEERVFLARPKPSGKSSINAMILHGTAEFVPPDFSDLQVNASVDVIKEELDRRLGIEDFKLPDRQGDDSSEVGISCRQGFFYCFQAQHEVANPTVLFHRQQELGVNQVIKRSFPYYMGAATLEQSKQREQRRIFERSLRAVRSRNDDLDQQITKQHLRIEELLDEAVELDLIDDSAREFAATEPEKIFSLILEPSERKPLSSSDTGCSGEGEVAANIGYIKELQRRLLDIDSEIDIVRESEFNSSLSFDELDTQHGRLTAGKIMLGRSLKADADTKHCPLCDSELKEADASVADLNYYLEQVDSRISRTHRHVDYSSHVLAELGKLRERTASELRELTARRAARVQNAIDSESSDDLEVRVAFLRGRVSQEARRGVEASREIVDSDSSIRSLEARIASLDELLEGDDVSDRLATQMESLGADISGFAKSLDLEGAGGRPRLNPKSLKLYVDSEDGRVPLSRLGGGANWVGYHMAVHLALHKHFMSSSRPVPRFLILDQPSQVFFPEKVDDASSLNDVDWNAVRRQFRTLYDFVEGSDVGFQVIVTEHANLDDDWFRDSVVENWRMDELGSDALIPDSWIMGLE